MKKSHIIFISLAVVSAAFFLWAWNRSSVQPPQATTDAGVPYNAATSSALEAKTNSDGWADIEVTPSSLAPSEWSFKVILNAHQELDANPNDSGSFRNRHARF